MPAPDLSAIAQALNQHFGASGLTLDALDDPCPWSQTYVVVVTGQRYFVKGTPRRRPEAQVTKRLAAHCPTLLPQLLATDLVPAAPWCWFLTADAGACDHTVLEPERAGEAAYALGALQRTVRTDPWFVRHLPRCEARQLQHQTLQACQWALERAADAAMQAHLRRMHTELAHATGYFNDLAATLQELPPSCVHGDFWPGNIALSPTGVRIIDWADAVWGVGGAAIWNLLLTSQPTLAQHHALIWDAYSWGWERPVSAAYRDAAYSAHAVTDLVVDQGFAPWQSAEMDLVPGIRMTLEHLLERIRV